MIDLGREIEASVRAAWSDQRREAVYTGVRPRHRRRMLGRVALGTVTTIAVLIGGWLMMPAHGSAPTQPIATHDEPSQTRRLGDGWIGVPTSIDSRLRTVSDTPSQVIVALERGGARFEVPDGTRVFRVTSGRVTVESFGAMFACSQVEQQTRVEVVRGIVHVLWDDQQRELTAGDNKVFPDVTPAKAPPPEPPPTRLPPHPSRIARDSWRDLARDGDYDRAYVAFGHTDVPVRDEPEELLLLADVKRLSHHPAEAIAPLRQIVRDHAGDPRASLAAFTLGRVLLEELGRPAEAAESFAQAVKLSPDGPMAEDAIAREVEALSRAGDAMTAQHLAEDYLERFPHGRKVRSVRRFGGLE